MYFRGYLSTVVYMISLTVVMFAAYNQGFVWIGLALGALFFFIGTIIVGLMVKDEIKRGISWKFW